MGFNRRLFEVMVYSESFPMDTLEEILGREAIVNYAYITHDSCRGDDGSLLKAHTHIMIRTKDTRNSDNVAKWFGVLPNQVGKVKGRFADALKYLTHENAPSKYQYLSDQVVSNFDWKTESQKLSSAEKTEKVNLILEKICNGELKEYNYTDYITGLEYVHNKQKFAAAFEYRAQRIQKKEREMDSIYITGESGSGKTSFAKYTADSRGLSYFISSGSNDVLDGYKGEECIILDDFRGSVMSLSDLLKMLDPNTASTVKSRYRNKVLECKLIIITTTISIEEFFKNVFKDEKESVIQLKRRCNLHVEITPSQIIMSLWDKESRLYLEPKAIPNFIINARKFAKMNEKEQIEELQRITGMVSEFAKTLKPQEKGSGPNPQSLWENDLYKNENKYE